MTCASFEFSGQILRRGFWIYVWKITGPDGTKRHYVGRTGDSSSLFAASPFVRVGRHLDSRENAKSNSLHKCLVKAGLDPKACAFAMHAVGPLFPEQTTPEEHRRHRDVLACIEAELAGRLGSTVFGTHQRPRRCDDELFQRTLTTVLRELAPHLSL